VLADAAGKESADLVERKIASSLSGVGRNVLLLLA
jgi:hypothetical protein